MEDVIANTDPSPVTRWRKRRQQQGCVHVEIQIRKEDAAHVREVATALDDPVRATETRAILPERILAPRSGGLKALLTSAPLDGIISNARAILGVAPRCDSPDRHEYHLGSAQGDRGDPAVAAWWNDVAEDDLCLNSLVLGEIRKGVELARHHDPRKADALEAWLADVMSRFGNHVLPIDTTVVQKWVG